MKSIELLAAHMLGDYIFQTNEEAVNKFTDIEYLQTHCFKYALAFVPFVGLSKGSLKKKLAFVFLNHAAHMVVDSRRWASGEEWAPKPILVDQTIHAITLAVLNRLFLED